MHQLIPIDIMGGAYAGRSRNNIQELINMYVAYDLVGGEDKTILQGTPGLTGWFDTGELEEIRGFNIFQSELWVVAGDTLYYINGPSGAGGSKTSKGTLNTSAGRVQTHNNGTDLAICDGQNVYSLTSSLTDKGSITVASFLALSSGSYGDYYTFSDSGSGITAGQIGTLNNDISATITADDYSIFDDITETALIERIEASYMAYQDGWFIALVPNTASALCTTDPSNWDGAPDIAAEGDPDNLVAAISDYKQLMLFGEKSIEIQYITGSAVLPFSRISGGVIGIGCIAKNSVVEMNDQVYFLDEDYNVRRVNGLQTEILSSPSIQYQMSQLQDQQEAVAYSYSIEGHYVYVITFSESDITYCFDSNMKMWYKWSTGGYNSRHTTNCFIRYAGKNLAGDFSNGVIYEIDQASRTDNGTAIYRERIAQYITNKPSQTFFNKLILDIQTATEPGSEPEIMLDFSDDYGKTWSLERRESLGAAGEYTRPVEFCALGSAQSRAFRIRITDDCFVSIQDAQLIGGVGWY